ncbi:MAG TPA: Stf0 family sulfotransferase, partial [Ktedonobacteraceae bacterium]|nr:Stf0 family sulfotransferase [Ktedonobacteraceae bacterium]
MHLTCSYLTCATPRSGSTLLCEALSNTGLAGYPKEYFEALRATGLPRRPWEYFSALEDPEIIELLEDSARPDDGA